MECSSGFIECRIWIFCKSKYIETTGVSGKSKSICQLFCFSKQNVPFHCHILYSFVLSEKEISIVAQRQKLGFVSVGNYSNEITSKVYHTDYTFFKINIFLEHHVHGEQLETITPHYSVFTRNFCQSQLIKYRPMRFFFMKKSW